MDKDSDSVNFSCNPSAENKPYHQEGHWKE